MEDEKASKRLKLDKKLESLEDVCFVKVLLNDANTKTIFLHGKYEKDSSEEKDVVIKLEKTPFEDTEAGTLFTAKTRFQETFNNDIYSNYSATLDPDLNLLRAVTIMPATSKHLLKYTKQDMYFVRETPIDYEEITLPHIIDTQYSLQWVYNILEHKAEVDRIIFEDADPETGFILVPDLKWNEQQLSDLHVTAIVNTRGISSIRDLQKDHLPMLKNVAKKGKNAIKEKYKLPPDQLRVYFHYHPSYYHLHVHFTAITTIGASCLAGKAHLLDDVIDNIENIDSNYYQKRTLSYVLGDQDLLLKKFIAAGKFVERTSSDP